MSRSDDDRTPERMRRPPNPYRVLAHAIDAGDRQLATLLSARLARRPRTAADRVVDRLLRALNLD